MRYILWVATLLGACEVIQNGHHLGFYTKMRNYQKTAKFNIFNTGHVECAGASSH